MEKEKRKIAGGKRGRKSKEGNFMLRRNRRFMESDEVEEE